MDPSFFPTEKPMWRRTDIGTSAMLDKIAEYLSFYQELSPQLKSWAMAEYVANQAYGEFLFQVNHMEGEGFNTLKETQDAINKGALSLAESPAIIKHDDGRLESVCCLYRALRHWFKPLEDEASALPKLSIEDIEKSHLLLLCSTKKDIACRIRSNDHEIVFVETDQEPGIHIFMWPTQVRCALKDLLERTESELVNLQHAEQKKSMSKVKVEQYLKLGATFFLEFESIHPFMDGNGRCGRIVLAYLLRDVMPFPNVLFVDSPEGSPDPPFVNPLFYYDCFQDVQSPQKIEFEEDGQPHLTKEAAVCTLGGSHGTGH